MRHFLTGLLVLWLWCATAGAQTALLSPGDFLPHPYGQQFTPHHLLVDYVEHAAQHSDRVSLQQYGRSAEGRPLLLAIISTPANLARIEQIRTDHLRSAGLLEGTATSSGEPPAIVWLSFGVHGNEAGASESSMTVLHALADPRNAETGKLLENTVVILDPCLNPDGYDRYISWYRQVAPLEPDPRPFAREHQEPWPGGRPNHYLFDLNRDWAWGTQPETRQRLVQYQRWMPHVHADYHEQSHDSPYYFAPASEPYHPAVTDWQRQFQTWAGKANASRFDEEGWLYFTREEFDLFYPGYGDTYPTFSGAIGMTYEQAGHGMAGRAIELENGEQLTLADRIEHHAATALATLATASLHARELDRQFQAFYQRAQNQPAGEYKAFVLRHTNRPDQLKAFARFLDMHQIRYGKAGKRQTAEGYAYASGTNGLVTIEPDDLVVSAFQPASVLVRTLLEPGAGPVDSLTYDITAWSVIHAFGLEAWALTGRLDPQSPWKPAPYLAPDWPEGEAYAFLLPWTSMQDARFLAALFREGIGVRVASQPFRMEDRSYGRGTLVITLADNRRVEGFSEKVKQIALAHERNLTAVRSGLVDAGSDFGSGTMQFLKAPRVALIGGEQTRSSGFGATWYFFEQVLQYPVAIIEADDFKPSRLAGFDVLVLPEGNYTWSDAVKIQLSEWMRSGGRLIATGGALRWVQQLDGVRLVSKDIPQPQEKDAKSETPLRYEERNSREMGGNVPGTIFRAELDNSHPIGYGFPGYYYTLKIGAQSYAWLEKGWNIAYLKKSPVMLGHAGANAHKKLEDSVVVAMDRVGNGAAIYLADDPLFRAFWHNGHFLFANALFFGGL